MTDGTNSDSGPKTRWAVRSRAGLCAGFAALVLGFVGLAQSASAEDRSLSLYNLHTRERATVVYKRDGKFDSAGLSQLNHILRDWRRNQPTKMDPQLFDLIWEVYRKTGATQPINIVCGYRAPATNAMLRRRSKAVAQNSQHMNGKAMDFFIPGVPLSRLRAVGLQAGVGGVGFYPSSGSPFVHMDTGSVRHWPRMTRSQLVAVFPHGGTLHVPSDGKPLPNYAQALAAYKARKSGAPVAIASYETDEADDSAVDVAAADIPTPRPAPERNAPEIETVPVVIAQADAGEPPRSARTGLRSRVDRVIGDNRPDPIGRLATEMSEVEFDALYTASTPRVPVDLIAAMAERDQSIDTATASLPIAPTSVVATIDVTRPLRAEAMTTAVLRGNDTSELEIPQVLAFASAAPEPREQRRPRERLVAAGIPGPHKNPMKQIAAAAAPARAAEAPAAKVASVYDRLPVVELTLTALDTQGLRLWIQGQSTREKRYALLTMPDFSHEPTLIEKPEVSYAAGFSHTAYPGLRTDKFAGQLVQPPAVVDLTLAARFAAAD